MDYPTVTNPETNRFLKVFFTYQTINRRFYELVPKDKLNFRLTSKSDTILQHLAHQVNAQHSYLQIAKTGQGKFKDFYDPNMHRLTRPELFSRWDQLNQELIAMLSDPGNLSKTVIVKWSDAPISLLSFFWALNDHEILHNGINIAHLNILNIPRFPELTAVWG